MTELKEEVITEIIGSGKVVTPNSVSSRIRSKKKINIKIEPDSYFESFKGNDEDISEIEVEEEEIAQKEELKKIKTLTIYQLEAHEDPEINAYLNVLKIMPQFYNNNDFKGFKESLEYIINQKLSTI